MLTLFLSGHFSFGLGFFFTLNRKMEVIFLAWQELVS